GALDAPTATSEIQIRPQNNAPVLDNARVFTLTPITRNQTNTPGTEITDLLASAAPPKRITDPDPGAVTGIAITGADNTNGTWQFSIDSGANWTNLGSPTVTQSLLLFEDLGSRVRFVPNAGF